MSNDYFFPLVFLSWVVYRVARFICLDTLIEGTRDKVLAWLDRPGKKKNKIPLWRGKLAELITCPFCVSIWVSAATVYVTNRWFLALPVPVFWWLALSTGALLCWGVLDSE